MNQHPVTALDPVFHWLDWVIATYGLEIYMVAAWLSPFVIAWILRGGFWRRPPRRGRVVKAPPVITLTKATPPPLPLVIVEEQAIGRQRFDDIQSFAA